MIAITAVILVWPAHNWAQERLSINERIATLEQDLPNVGLSRELDQLLEELDKAGEVSRETARQFWTSALRFSFAGQTEATAASRSLIDQMVAAQDAPSVHPLKWKIVGASFQRRVAASQYLEVLRGPFEVGTVNLEALHRAEQEVADAEVDYYQSVLHTMPSAMDHVAKRLLTTYRLNAARARYLSSLITYKGIRERAKLGIVGGSPDREALMRVEVFRWQARVYALQCELEELQP
jgi:hypothetical protein